MNEFTDREVAELAGAICMSIAATFPPTIRSTFIAHLRTCAVANLDAGGQAVGRTLNEMADSIEQGLSSPAPPQH